MELQFNATKKEMDAIMAATKRCRGTVTREPIQILMDLEVTHSNGTPLDFDALLAFDDFSFFHDINGIANNLNRRTGQLENCFLPRCAKPSPVADKGETK
jgi:hypothetical protein